MLKRIQATAVSMAVQQGLNNITTEAIAREAGISTRTFFNYYPYKEAAIMGPPPDYPVDAGEAFISGRGKLLDDLNTLISAHLTRFLHEREIIADMLRLCDTDPKLTALKQATVLARRAHMADLLRRRMPTVDRRMLELLAAGIVAATNGATDEWVFNGRDDFLAVAREYLALILPAAELLNS